MTPEPSLSDDTIVAVASPPGAGALGLIRISGPRAVAIASRILRFDRGAEIGELPPRTLTRTKIVDPDTDELIDDALVAVMRGPRSYTGEDVVELSCHGNPVLLSEVVRGLVNGGARMAGPGEFTRRAYLNGRLGLLEAEAVAELISARSERAARLAVRQLRGGLADAIGAVRESLLDLVAGLEVALDFPDDEIGISRIDGAARLAELNGRVERLLHRMSRGRAVQDGLTVMLTGTPNVGKSSMLNVLLGVDRAIVSPTPGTTRDLVDGALLIHGVTVRLLDGAGLGHAGDELDAEGMRRARQALEQSDLVIVVLDRSRPLTESDRQVIGDTAGHERLVVANKTDLDATWDEAGIADCGCSAVTGAGVDVLRKRIEQWVDERIGADGDEGGIVASTRALDTLERAGVMLTAARTALEHAPFEAVLVDLHGGLSALGEMLGLVSDDEILDRIFATFCVGK